MEKPPHVNTESTGTEKNNNLELIRPDASLEVIPIGFCSLLQQFPFCGRAGVTVRTRLVRNTIWRSLSQVQWMGLPFLHWCCADLEQTWKTSAEEFRAFSSQILSNRYEAKQTG